MPTVRLTVNDRTHTLDLDVATPLLYVLSDDLGLRGPKFGCGLAQCGSCTAIVDSQRSGVLNSRPSGIALISHDPTHHVHPPAGR